MSRAENISNFVNTIHSNSRESVPRDFWTNFVADLEAYIDGLNSDKGKRVLIIHSRDEQSIEVDYEGHLLSVLFDVRTGTLRYWFVTPKLRHLTEDEKGLTGTGTVQLDFNEAFKVTSSPSIDLGDGVTNSNDWPTHDRLAQYLLQKLIVPGLVDARF